MQLNSSAFPLLRLGALGVTLPIAFGCSSLPDGTESELLRSDQVAIKGGTDAVAGAWPWQARVTTAQQLCGGSLVSTEWVLTAGHCVEGEVAGAFTVVLGEHDLSQSD